MANSIWQRVGHKIWEVNEQLQGADPETTESHVSEKFVKTVLARLTPEEHAAYMFEATSQAISSELADIWDDGCVCEEHLAEYREAAAVAGGEGA